jgi:hypothetical protein
LLPQTDAFKTDDKGIRKYFAAGSPPDEQAVVAATQGPFHVRATAIEGVVGPRRPTPRKRRLIIKAAE